MLTLATLIDARRDEILRHWMAQAERSASARGLSELELVDSVPAYLTSLAARVRGRRDRAQAEREKDTTERHIGARLRQGFDLDEVVHEYFALADAVARVAAEAGADAAPAADELEAFYSAISDAVTAAVSTFTTHLIENEQREKRYLREIDRVVRGAIGGAAPAPPFVDCLDEVLRLFAEALDAEHVTLLLRDEETGAERVAASFGVGAPPLGLARGDGSLAVAITGSDDLVAVEDLDATPFDLPDSVRTSGVRILLGRRLHARGQLLGALYVARCAAAPFTAAARRLMIVLSERLAGDLYDASLHGKVAQTVRYLEAERDLRQQFVSVLAHDLRGPLNVVKLTAQLLRLQPERAPHLVAKLAAAGERMDRMVRDLLDTHRVHAGERLPLKLDVCDLVGIARAVADELTASHGARFVVDAPQSAWGVWDGDELWRALWNLGTNAVKYGASGTVITIAVRASHAGPRLSVHNEGAVIRAEDRARLFDPFHRARATPKTGWGLGLTLVRGCAEAHGGRVEVESAPGCGTTFTIAIPWDARPYQVAHEATPPRPGG